MKKILILLFIFLLAGCLPEKEKAPLSHFINVRLANGVFQIKLEPAVAPGAAEHFLNLIKQNVYDGAILGTKDSMLFIYPDSNLEIIKTKIAEEKSAITKKAMIFGLVRSPIVEKGDSVFFLCLKECYLPKSEYIPLGEVMKSSLDITQIKSGERVLTILLK